MSGTTCQNRYMDVPEWQAVGEVLADAFEVFRDPRRAAQWGAVLLALAGGWLLTRKPGRLHAAGGWVGDLAERLWRPGAIVLLALLAAAALALAGWPHAGPQMLAVLAASLAAVRLLLYLLRRGMNPGPLLDAFEHTVSGVIWAVVALYLLGWLGPARDLLDGLALSFGETRFSLLDLLTIVVVVALLLLAAGLLSRLLERRVMAAGEVSIGVRVGVAKVLRFTLVLLALLVGLNIVGVNLTSLAVFSGALGVGIGFGLQRIASNFISGFILIMDRSIRPGDVITVGDSFGWVKELNARYVVVRSRDGVETLIPNENLITSEVINWSYSDKAVRLKVPVQVSYDDDPIRAMDLLVEVGRGHPRVEDAPAPVARLMGFGDSGIELELRVWIDDPQEGVNNIRSELNVEIWKAFKREGITIPYPQRDLHLRSLPAGWHGHAGPAPD
jgi:small-conductance mechanosensitive channel